MPPPRALKALSCGAWPFKAQLCWPQDALPLGRSTISTGLLSTHGCRKQTGVDAGHLLAQPLLDFLRGLLALAVAAVAGRRREMPQAALAGHAGLAKGEESHVFLETREFVDVRPDDAGERTVRVRSEPRTRADSPGACLPAGDCRKVSEGRFRVAAERNEKLKSKVDKTVTLKLHKLNYSILLDVRLNVLEREIHRNQIADSH